MALVYLKGEVSTSVSSIFYNPNERGVERIIELSFRSGDFFIARFMFIDSAPVTFSYMALPPAAGEIQAKVILPLSMYTDMFQLLQTNKQHTFYLTYEEASMDVIVFLVD